MDVHCFLPWKPSGNCKIEVEEIAPGQELVVLSATKDLKEGSVADFVGSARLEAHSKSRRLFHLEG